MSQIQQQIRQVQNAIVDLKLKRQTVETKLQIQKQQQLLDELVEQAKK